MIKPTSLFLLSLTAAFAQLGAASYTTVLTLNQSGRYDRFIVPSVADSIRVLWASDKTTGRISEADLSDLTLRFYNGDALVYEDVAIEDGVTQTLGGAADRAVRFSFNFDQAISGPMTLRALVNDYVPSGSEGSLAIENSTGTNYRLSAFNSSNSGATATITGYVNGVQDRDLRNSLVPFTQNTYEGNEPEPGVPASYYLRANASETGNNWYWNAWLGSYFMNNTQWIYHMDYGWIYAETQGNSASGAWMYLVAERSWFFFSNAFAPQTAYSVSNGSNVFWDANTRQWWPF